MNENITLDQKIKAFEIASRIVTIGEPKEDTQEAFNSHMDGYLSTCAGIASLILQAAGKIQI
jgi:hypothetical protein